MDSIDLQNGVFEEEGLQLLEKWEKESPLLAPPPKGKKTAEKPLDLPKNRKNCCATKMTTPNCSNRVPEQISGITFPL